MNQPVEEKICVVTVRMPEAMHKLLKIEAHQKLVSLNQLCLAKLRQHLASDAIKHEWTNGKEGTATTNGAASASE